MSEDILEPLLTNGELNGQTSVMFGASLTRGLPAGKRQSPGTPPKPTAQAPVKQQVKPFTKESLERLENKTVQLVRDYGFQPRRKLSVEDGSVLPPKFEPFPAALYGKPLEEIDNFIYDETFCVVSKRFKKNYIHRFTATRSIFIFSPWNKFRQTCIFLSTNQYFDYVVMATILLNCVFLAMTEPVDEAEFAFLAIYTAEMLIKAVAKGFILNKYTYLRNPWNWLDFVVITSGYVTIGMDVGNLAGLRTFRVLRALKTVSIMPGLKTIINALLHSFKQLAEVMTLTIFCLMVFALFALQVYMGELRNKCVILASGNLTDLEWLDYVWNETSWQRDEEDNVIMCGNTTGSRHCESGFVCLRVGPNPNFGYTNFDNFLWSMLTTFQLITLDYWENVYNMVLATCGPISVVFFTVVVFFGSFYLINLMLAVVALSYEEEAEITQEERKKDLVDHRDDSTFSFDPTDLNVKQLDKHKKKKVDSRKGVLLSSYTKKKTRRRKAKGKDGSGKGNGSTPSPSVSPRPSDTPPVPPTTPTPRVRPHALAISMPDTPHALHTENLRPENTLAVSRGQLSSRQASSNSGEGNFRESSLDDSGVVDDHEEVDQDDSQVQPANIPTETQKPESVIITIPSKDSVRVVKCNGITAGQDPQKLLHERLYSLPPDFLQVVVLEDLVDRNCSACSACCLDYEGWLRVQNGLYKLVRDPLFELLITVCIVLNTIFLAVEHHGMSEHVRQALDIGNKVFTSIFTFECFLKLLALSKEFFDCGWNIFDLIIVSASLLDLSIEIMDGLTVLRGLRLLRVLKLAQSWTTMKVLLSIIISTIGALGNLTFVLVIVIYIFAVIGMQLFSKDYTSEKFAPDPVPRWNFNDFFHSFMMIFRILCGEWIEPLWDCMRAEQATGAETCFFIFLPALVMGNFMVLNLFLALLLNSFNSEELKNKKEEVGEDSKISRSFDRIRSIVKKKRPRSDDGAKNMKMEVMVRQMMVQQKTPIISKRSQEPNNEPAPIKETIFHSPMQPNGNDMGRPVFASDTQLNLFSPGPRFPSSPTLSQQLQQVLDEKIKSLQSSRNQLFEFSELELSRVVDRESSSDKLYSPPVEVVNREGSAWESSPSPRPHRAYTPRPSQHQLTFLSPPGSDSFPSEPKMGPVNVVRYSDNQASPLSERRSTGKNSRRSSGASDVNERTSLGISDPVMRDLSLSESDPVYSPPSRSSVSDCRYSAVFSPPSDANFSFSLSTDKKHDRTLSPHTDSEASTNHTVDQQGKFDSTPAEDNTPTSVIDLTSPPARDKRYYTVIQTGPPSYSESKHNKPEEPPRTARDKRLSYFLAIEQGESKDSDSQDTTKKEVPHTETLKEMSEEVAEKSKKPWQALVSYVDELTVGGRRDSHGRYIDGMGNFPGFGRNKKNLTPQDCFPSYCYQRSVCCNHCLETEFGQSWTNCRKYVLSYVDTPVFEWVILVLIFSSSITLCFEDIYLDENKSLKNILYWTNFVFSALFSIEMLLKWVALGFWRYFTSFWTILDFIIVFVSIFSLLIEENENLKVLRSLRTLRALRPLRAISRWQGMRIVVNALMYAIPSIFNVLLVCLVFWLIFSIMGVQFFGGKFFKCLDEDGELLPISIVNDGTECIEKNFTWVNSKISFDHVGQAYLALFQVATFEGWMEVMADAVDARGENLQPQREANLYAYVYFVIFIVCGSFFTLNLFIGVIIDNFNMLKKKYEGGVLEMFLTESQKHYYTAMKKLGRKKPQKVIHRPLNQFLAMFYDLSNSRRFEIAIFILIFLNMVSMAIEHYDQPHAVFFILEVSNAFFTTVFGLEACVKIIGLRYHYFTVPWNVFDFLLVLASILGILMEDIMIDFPVSPTLLRVVRVFRIGRILRLIKAAKGIRKLLFALVVSLPALFNIGALLALITFIYAIIGMSLFGHVKKQGALDDMVNFETFGRSMQLLFRLMTSAGWNDVLESLMIQPPDCNEHKAGTPNGDCGHPLLAITYFTSFIIISYMIVINMYIAIILENFNQAHQEEEIGIVEDDLEMFYIRWSKYDPHATQFIRFQQLSDFIASLDPPLGIPKPNTVALVSFNLPIARGNKIHCLDILHALVKHVLGHVEESDDFKKLQDQMDIKFKKQFPTRKELEIVSSTRIWKRQDKAARLIQKTFNDYLRRKREKDKEDLEDEMTQTSSPGGGWQGRLSAFLHVHRGSRASSRKSSRASDASDLSELGGPWLNLPLLLLGGAQINSKDDENAKGQVCITVSEPSPENADAKLSSIGTHLAPRMPVRRGSFSFLQRRSSNKETPRLLRHSSAKEPSTRRYFKSEPKVEPGVNVQSEDISHVNILVTEPSPQDPPQIPIPAAAAAADKRRAAFRLGTDSTVVHALVHRESEEYSSQEPDS